MIALHRILLPTDFSDNSRAAEVYALAFAARFQAEVHVLHVLQDVVPLAIEPGAAFAFPPDFQQELLASARTVLQQVPQAVEPGFEPHLVREVRQGIPHLEICRYAQEAGIDLIVLGTHGRTGLMHALLGSVAERVVRHASCPVLTVHPTQQSAP